MNLRIIIALSILPIIRTNLSGLYLLQLKEYRRDRLKDFFRSKEGKRYVFNKFFWIYLIIFVLIGISIYLFFITSGPNFLIGTHITIGYISTGILLGSLLFLGLDSLYFLYQIVRKKFKLPKKTFRAGLVFGLTLFLQIIGFYTLFGNFFSSGRFIYDNSYYFQILYFNFVILIGYLTLFISNLIISPIINYQKKQTYLKARKKIDSFKNNLISIGITGSYGKSSVKTLLFDLLSTNFPTICTPENVNTEMGVANLILSNKFPLTKGMSQRDRGFDTAPTYFVSEMGAYRTGEIRQLGEIVNHKYGFLTGIGNQHIGLFGSQENIIKGKFEIIQSVIRNDGKLYMNIDAYNKVKMCDLSHLEKKYITTYGLDKSADAYSEIKEYKDGKIYFDFSYKGKDKSKDFSMKNLLSTNLIGEHNILNLTGILAFLEDQGIDINSKEIREKLQNLSKPKNTLDVIKKENMTLIDDSYNLSVDGLWAGVDFLKYFQGDKILVLDDIIELGKESEKIHFEIGQKLAKTDIKHIVLVGKNYGKYVEKGYLENGGNIQDISKDPGYISKDLWQKDLIGAVILFEGRETKKLLDKIK